MQCPITLEPINTVCELTTCGHAFEYMAIINYVFNGVNNGCPLCRTPFTFNNIYLSRNLQNYINLYNNRNDASTQTQFISPVEVVWKRMVEATKPLFNVGADDHFRIIDADDFINSASNTISHEQAVIRLNERFYDGRPIPIDRYVYQSSVDDVASLARTLALTGYFVYDLFKINSTRGLHRYVLYTKPTKLNGNVVHLSKYKRLSNRI